MKNVSFTQYELKRLLGFYYTQYEAISGQVEEIKGKLKALKEEQERRRKLAEETARKAEERKRVEEERRKEEEERRKAKEKSRQMREVEDSKFREVANDIRGLPWDILIETMLKNNAYYMSLSYFLDYSFNILQLPKSHKEVIDKEIRKALVSLEKNEIVNKFVPEDSDETFYGMKDWFYKNGRPKKKYFKKKKKR